MDYSRALGLFLESSLPMRRNPCRAIGLNRISSVYDHSRTSFFHGVGVGLADLTIRGDLSVLRGSILRLLVGSLVRLE